MVDNDREIAETVRNRRSAIDRLEYRHLYSQAFHLFHMIAAMVYSQLSLAVIEERSLENMCTKCYVFYVECGLA